MDSIRTSIDLPRDLHRRLHEAATRKGRSTRQLILRSIERAVEESTPKRPAASQPGSADPRFVPPLLNFHASDYLSGIARQLVEILTARSGAIAGLRRQKNQSLADFTAADIANFWLLYTVNTAFPLFRHLFETRGGHPEELFAAMLSLAGSLTTFSAKVHPRDLPAYDHDNLGGCFTELDEKLRMLLDTVVATNVVSLPLKLLKPSIYPTPLDNR